MRSAWRQRRLVQPCRPSRCVGWGAWSSGGYLSDQGGKRLYLCVRCGSRGIGANPLPSSEAIDVGGPLTDRRGDRFAKVRQGGLDLPAGGGATIYTGWDKDPARLAVLPGLPGAAQQGKSGAGRAQIEGRGSNRDHGGIGKR